MHGSAVVGKRLYVFGGNSEVGEKNIWHDSVISAEIKDDSSIGEWRTETIMPQKRLYIGQAVEVINDNIYVCGGTIAPSAEAPEKDLKGANTVAYTSVKSDGTLDNWKLSAPFSATGRSNVATCSNENFLYITGGRFSKIFDEILCATIDENGDPQQWRVAGSLPTPLWFHGAAVIDGKMVVWGGITSNSPKDTNENVWIGHIDPDGNVSRWESTAPLPSPLYSSVFCGFNDYLIAVGGRYTGAIPTNDIWYAQMVNGKVDKWNQLTTDLGANLFHSLGLDKTRGTIYIVGGRFREGAGRTAPSRIVTEVAAFRLGSKAAPAQASGTAVAHSNINQALAAAARNGKEVLAYFYSPDVPACTRFASNILENPTIKQALSNFEFVKIDASKDSQTGYKYSIFRVPALIRLTPQGELAKKSRSLLTTEDATSFLR